MEGEKNKRKREIKGRRERGKVMQVEGKVD